MQMTNAKIILFDLTVYSSFVLPYSSRFIDLLPVAALLLIAGPGANMVWLLAGNLLRPHFHPYLPLNGRRFISVALSLKSPSPGFLRRSALWCSDFPRWVTPPQPSGYLRVNIALFLFFVK